MIVNMALAASSLALLSLHSSAQPTAPVNGVGRPDPGLHSIINATLIPEPGKTIDDATIDIKDGVIVRVSAGGEPGTGARVWDYSGLTIYPGLIDPYVPVDAPRPDSAAEGTHWNPRVTPQRSALDGAGLSAEARKKLRTAGVAIAAIAPKDGIFRGTSAVVTLGETPAGESEAARMLVRRAYHTLSLDAGGGGDTGRASGGERYPGSKMGAIALVRQTLADVPWYSRAWSRHRADPANAPRPASSNALAALTDEIPLLFDVGDELDALRTAALAKEAGRNFLLVGSGTEYQRLSAVSALKTPIILPLAFAEQPKVATLADREAVDLTEMMTWEQSPTNPRRLDAAGVTLALTAAKLPKGQEFWPNLRKAIKHGLSEERALALMTTAPATILGIADRAGTVAPGKAAHLVVVKGSLFAKDREIRDVWIDGERYEIKPAPAIDAEGEYAATFALPGGAAPLTGTLKIGKKNEVSFEPPAPEAGEAPAAAQPAEAPKDAAPPAAEGALAGGEKPKKPAAVKARAASLVENRLNFVLDGEKLKLTPGVITLSGLIAGPAITGEGTLPDGSRFTWSAQRQVAAEPKKSDDDKEDDEPAPTDIPDALGFPFGPYAYEAVPEQKTLIITNATIWTSGPQGIIQNGWMVVMDGKVESLGAGGAPRGIPDGATVIDAQGKHITPGLIDCHSHTGISGGVNEGTHACTSEVRIGDVINPDAIGWYRELAGGLTAVNQLHGSANPIGGQNSVVKIRWGVAHPDEMRVAGAPSGIKFALGENVKQSNWDPRPTPLRYPQTRMGVETFIRDRFAAARDYGARRAAWTALSDEQKKTADQPRIDFELEALWEILRGERLVHCHSYRQDEILMLCRVARDFGFTIGTFQHVLEGYKVAEAIKNHAIGGSSFSDWWAYKWEVYDAVPHNGAIMHAVGVTVSFNSDSDELARRMNTEASKAVKYGGVTPEEALKFVTINPAKQLKIDDRTGSLEAGKDADFVIWSGDPLSTFSRCEATYVDGREYFSLARDAQIRERIGRERQRLIQKILADSSAKKKDADEKDGAGSKPQPSRLDVGEDSIPPRPTDDLRAGAADPAPARGRFLTPAGDGREASELAELEFARRLERHYLWMIRNGLDPFRAQPGDCGCAVNCLFGQE